MTLKRSFAKSGENAELIAECRLLQEEAEEVLAQQEQNRQSLETANQLLQAQHDNTERSVNEARQQVYSLKAQIESLRSSEGSTSKQIDRLQTQHQHSVERIADLERKLQQTLTPLDEEKQQLEQRLLDKDQLEDDVKKTTPVAGSHRSGNLRVV